MYLLDTNVISELRRSRPDLRVAAWAAQCDPASHFLSVATCFEVQRGITRLTRKDTAKANELANWLTRLVAQFGSRLIGIDGAIARKWGELAAKIGHEDIDLAIAATAAERGLVVATRNVSDFLPAGVSVYDPFMDRMHKPS